MRENPCRRLSKKGVWRRPSKEAQLISNQTNACPFFAGVPDAGACPVLKPALSSFSSPRSRKVPYHHTTSHPIIPQGCRVTGQTKWLMIVNCRPPPPPPFSRTTAVAPACYKLYPACAHSGNQHTPTSPAKPRHPGTEYPPARAPPRGSPKYCSAEEACCLLPRSLGATERSITSWLS